LDKETVQTTNTKEATKVVVVRITDWSLVQVQVPPPIKTSSHDGVFVMMFLIARWEKRSK
jgi:hypothetical protein